MATASRREHRDVKVLHNIPFDAYVRMVEDPANAHLRMAYHDGTLELVSPTRLEHERPSRRLGQIVTAVADALNLLYEGIDRVTFKRPGPGPAAGVGKEPDQAFYLASVARLPRDRAIDLEAGDPPPDLWIEVDHRASSSARLPVYARLGVPEVWQYRVRRSTVRFLGLVDGRYQSIGHSRALPVLTPDRVQEALALGDGLIAIESVWVRQMREWARRIVAEA